MSRSVHDDNANRSEPVEAEAVAAYRTDLIEKIERGLVSDDRSATEYRDGFNSALDYVLRLLTDGAEPPRCPCGLGWHTVAEHDEALPDDDDGDGNPYVSQ